MSERRCDKCGSKIIGYGCPLCRVSADRDRWRAAALAWRHCWMSDEFDYDLEAEAIRLTEAAEKGGQA